MDPSALDAYATSEIASSRNPLFADLWGPKLAMVLIGIGALSLLGLHTRD